MKVADIITGLRTIDAQCNDLTSGDEQTLQDAIAYLKKIQSQVSIMHYVYQQIKALEMKTGFVIVLQFATHPSGNIAMVFRAHNPRTSTEAPPISDVILLDEVENNADVIPRLEVLFKEIHTALNSLQVINPKKMLEVIH